MRPADLHLVRSSSRLAAVAVPLALLSCSTGQATNAVAGPQQITVSIVPHDPSVLPLAQVPFGALVTGTANTAVTWTIVEGAGGGSIDPDGLYTAPASTGTYHVVATSVAAPAVSDTSTVLVGTVPTTGIIPAARRTTWEPGIPGGIPARTTICATANAATYGNGSTDATTHLQGLIDGCPAGQVVSIPAGTYKLTAGLNISKGIVLRGAGPTQTKLRGNGSDWIIAIFPGWPSWSASRTITSDIPKDGNSFTTASTAGYSVGDTIFIDQSDDTSYLYEGMGSANAYFKRGPQSTGTGGSYGPASPSNAIRSMGQMVEITGISGSTITFSPAAHLPFDQAHTAQFWKAPAVVKYAGVEELYVTGGGGGAGDFFIQDASYCWLKHVESDGTVSSSPASDGTLGSGNGMVGDHVMLSRTFRCIVRDSYIHHATHVVQGGGAYGISFSNYSSDNLIENNIVYYMNKPLTMRASGGGNVVAYNYIDNAWTSADPALQETTMDLGHASFPHMELAEGNYCPQIATENVWGNSGWMTIFRNYMSGRQQRTDAFETYQIAALSMEIKAVQMNVIGNVMGSTGTIGADSVGNHMQYEVLYGGSHSTAAVPDGGGPDQAAVWRIGQGLAAGMGTDDIGSYESPTLTGATFATTSTYQMLLRLGNWDVVRGRVDNVPTDVVPDSLYLIGKPSFFGSTTWPWVDASTGTIATLPAHERFLAGTP